MTEQQKRQLAQPITDLYADLTDELMTAIAQQLASYGQLTETARWKAKKLLQSGELNQRVMKIIAQRTKICPELILAAVENAAWAAVNEIEPELQEAARQGLVSDAAIAADASVMQALTMYQRQAEQACNLVNTVMLYKARDAYTGIVNHAAELAEKPEYLQILGKRTGAVVTGMQSRRAAVRQCIHEFAEKGLPGFVDKRGREWSPEAYINMDIRTTVNNTAHETQFARMDAYGSDLIEVSSHIGARPLCAPYQGKLYSRSGKSGYTTDLNGNRIPYEPWSTTSYGQPAGLLGINCGHYVYAFFPGLSTQTYESYDTEQNAETYKQSQRQRYLERRIRASKRECMMLDKLGDEEGFKKAAVRLKERKAALNHFLGETGRAERADRAQAVGFGRSQARKASATAKKHIDMIEDFSRRMQEKGYIVKGFDRYYGDRETLSHMLSAFEHMATVYPQVADGLTIAYSYSKNPDDIGWYDSRTKTIGYNRQVFGNWNHFCKEYKELVEKGWFPEGTTPDGAFYHEFGHAFAYQNGAKSLDQEVKDVFFDLGFGYMSKSRWKNELNKELSIYATSDVKPSSQEVIAESFSEWYTSNDPRRFCIAFMKKVGAL